MVSIKFKFDIFNNPNPFEIYLCKPNRKILCSLNGIDKESANIDINLNNQYELSFDYNKYITIDDENVESNGYYNLDVGMEILVKDIGFFKMQYPPMKYDGEKEYKHITASSIDCELENKDLVNFKINTGESDSLEYLVTYDEDEDEKLLNDYTGLPYDYIVFYNTFDEYLTGYLNKYSDGVITDINSITDINNLCTLIPRLKNKLIEVEGNVQLVEYVVYTYDEDKNITQLELINFNERIQRLIEFYSKYKKQLSLIDLAIEKCNCYWEVGNIDKDLRNKKFQFNIDSQNIYSFLTQDISQCAKCVIEFDRFNKSIGAVLADNLGVDTGIFFNRRTTINELDISCNENNLCTRYSVFGENDLGIEYVNFGSSRIDDISYYLYATDNKGKRKYITDELANKYMQYMSDREIVREKYIDLTKQYNQLLSDIYDLEYLVPNDYLSDDWGQYTIDELENLLISYNNMRCVLLSLYKEEFGDVGLNSDNSVNEDYMKTTAYWHDYYTYTNIINQINAAIEAYVSNSIYSEIDNIDILKSIEAYKTEWSLYGTIELQNKIETYNNTMQVMIDSEVILLKNTSTKEPLTWNELSDSQKAEFNNEVFNYKYDEYYEIWNNKQSCKEYLDTLLVKVNNLKEQQKDIQINRVKIQQLIYIDNYNREQLSTIVDLPILENSSMYSFTKDEIQTINLLYIDKTYTNSNIFTTSLDTTVTTIDVQNELMLDAIDNLSIESQPQIIVSGSMDNFLAIKDFENIQKQFNLGNYMMCEYYDNYFIKLRLIGYSFNPCIPTDNISISFSNFIKSKSERSDITYLLGLNSGSGSSNSSSGSSSGEGTFGNGDNIDITLSNTMLAKLLNTELFGTRVTDVILDTIDVKSLTAKTATFGDLYTGTTTVNGKCITTGYIVDALYNGIDGSINNTSGSILNLETGLFNFGGGSLKWDGSLLSVNGYITANGGTIAGFTLGDTCLYNNKLSLYENPTDIGGVYIGQDGISYSTKNGIYDTSSGDIISLPYSSSDIIIDRNGITIEACIPTNSNVEWTSGITIKKTEVTIRDNIPMLGLSLFYTQIDSEHILTPLLQVGLAESPSTTVDEYGINTNNIISSESLFNTSVINDLTVNNSTTLSSLELSSISGVNNLFSLYGTMKFGNIISTDGTVDYYIDGEGEGIFRSLLYDNLAQHSSIRYKNNITYKDKNYWHDALMQVKPCTFNYNHDNTNKEYIGVIAEDLIKCMPELVNKDSDGNCNTVSYIDFIMPLVSESQRLNNIVDKQQVEIDKLKELINTLLNK